MPDNCIIPIQRKLDELYAYNKPFGFPRQPVGALKALVSNVNASVVETKLISQNGKKAKYQITYVEPDCNAALELDDPDAEICADGDNQPVQEDFLVIDNGKAGRPIELTVDEFRDLCNFGPNEYWQKQILGRFDTIARAINADIIAEIAAASGCFSGTEAGPRELQLINPETGIPNWGADTEIMADFMDAGLSTVPILIGGRELLHYANGRKNGGLNQDGVNMGAMSDFPMFYDNQLEGIAGIAGNNSAMFAIAPQIIHFVNHLDNVGDFQTNLKLDQNTDPLSLMRLGEIYNYGIIEDPFTGLMYDLDAVFDACTKTWKISFRSKYAVWQLPLTTCFANCFTGILKYSICPSPSLACPV